MKLIINGDTQNFPESDQMTLKELLIELKLTDGPVAVELNRQVVPRAEHERQNLQDNDQLEIVHFVGGG